MKQLEYETPLSDIFECVAEEEDCITIGSGEKLIDEDLQYSTVTTWGHCSATLRNRGTISRRFLSVVVLSRSVP